MCFEANWEDWHSCRHEKVKTDCLQCAESWTRWLLEEVEIKRWTMKPSTTGKTERVMSRPWRINTVSKTEYHHIISSLGLFWQERHQCLGPVAREQIFVWKLMSDSLSVGYSIIRSQDVETVNKHRQSAAHNEEVPQPRGLWENLEIVQKMR